MISTENPYSTSTITQPPNLGQGSVNGQVTKYAEEDKAARAPKTLPFQLDHFVQTTAATLESMSKLRQMVTQAKSNPNLSAKSIKELETKLDKIYRELIELPMYLEVLAL